MISRIKTVCMAVRRGMDLSVYLILSVIFAAAFAFNMATAYIDKKSDTATKSVDKADTKMNREDVLFNVRIIKGNLTRL